MNKWIAIGRATKDPDCRVTQDGNGIARYTLAVDRPFKKDGEDNNADFVSCIAFGKNADFVEKYIRKGTKIAVEGRIQTGSYTNKDGIRVYTTDAVIDKHYFCESKTSAGFDAIDAKIDVDSFNTIPDIDDDEIPFI